MLGAAPPQGQEVASPLPRQVAACLPCLGLQDWDVYVATAVRAKTLYWHGGGEQCPGAGSSWASAMHAGSLCAGNAAWVEFSFCWAGANPVLSLAATAACTPRSAGLAGGFLSPPLTPARFASLAEPFWGWLVFQSLKKLVTGLCNISCD